MRKIYNYKNIDDIDKKTVLKSLNKNHFVILRDLFSAKEIEKILKNLKKKFNHKKDNIRAKNSYNLIKTNYQRFMFGMSGGVKDFGN